MGSRSKIRSVAAPSERGSTLIEVVVALGLLGLVATSTSALVDTSALHAATAKEKITATSLAQSALETLVFVPVPTSSTGSPLLNKSIPVSTSPVIRSGISYQLFSQWSRQTTHTPPSTQTTLIVTVTVVWPPNGHASVASIAASTTQ